MSSLKRIWVRSKERSRSLFLVLKKSGPVFLVLKRADRSLFLGLFLALFFSAEKYTHFSEQKAEMSVKNERERTQKKEQTAGLDLGSLAEEKLSRWISVHQSAIRE